MTAGASGIATMIFEAQAHSWLAVRAGAVDCREVDIRRRRRDLGAKENLVDRDAPLGWRALRWVSEKREEADLSDNAGPVGGFGKSVGRPSGVRGVRHLIDQRQGACKEGLARREDVAIITVLGDHEIEDGADGLFA